MADDAQGPVKIRPLGFNAFVGVLFFIAGICAFREVFRLEPQETTVIHQLLTAAWVGLGVFCWGIAWIGSMLGDKG